MNINFKQPKFVLPLIMLPFLCLFFYVWHSSSPAKETGTAVKEGLNPSVGEVSGDVRKRDLANKLDAYRNTYKASDGLTAVAVIPKENIAEPSYNNDHTAEQKRMLDSIQRAMHVNDSQPQQHIRSSGYSAGGYVEVNAAVRETRQKTKPLPQVQQPDPMDVFRQQMAIMDSVTKQNDPQWKEEQKKRELAERLQKQKQNVFRLSVSKGAATGSDFNTVMPDVKIPFISAVIDENVTGYAGSRIRLKLLEDINAGTNLIPKGTYLYAQVSGFSEQRITLTVTSIMSDGKVLPVKLDIYDQDGLPGLYVPQSAFREFTKDLGGSSIQGVTIDGGTGGNQFVMSTLDKFFQSTSSAIAGAIRKNKARLKFNSFIYLIDTEALQNAQKSY